MLICPNAEGVLGQRKVGNPWRMLLSGTNQSRSLIERYENPVFKSNSKTDEFAKICVCEIHFSAGTLQHKLSG